MTLLILRELRLAATGSNALLPLIFFLLVATLFPFAVGPDRPLLARAGGGALWMAALLAALLPVDRLVEPDRANGVLDQLAVRGIRRGGSRGPPKLVGHTGLSFWPPLDARGDPRSGADEAAGEVLARLELGLLVGTPGAGGADADGERVDGGLRAQGALAGLAYAAACRCRS
jgi:heme exporter protein B